jgi:hypothetical protein
MTLATTFPNIKPTLLLDFANTKALDPRITFTRASTATYYGMQTAKAEENLLTRSQELGVGAWSTTNGTITANSTAAPDGTTTADTLIDDATSGAHVCAQVVTLVASSIYTQSFFLKANTNNFAIVTLSSTTTNNYISAVVNLSTGAITQTGTGTSATFTSSSITSVGSGWYRVVITGSTTSGFTRAEVGLAPAATGNTFATNGRIVYVGTGTSIFVWGAQLEQRSAVTAYTATTTQPITNYIPVLQTAASGVPRFEHNPVTGESLGLEIEESRTNLCLRSEDFSTTWVNQESTEEVNAAIAPDGTLTADKLIPTTANDSHWINQNITTTAAAHTFSFYAKAAGYSVVQVLNSADGTDRINFDLTNGTVGSATTYTGTITAVGNGWYRCTATYTTAATTAGWARIGIVPLSTSTRGAAFAGNGFAGVFIWGAQFELGAFATSYIPTVASQVTRAADAASMTGTNFSSWYNQAEGTIYAEYATASPNSKPVFVSRATSAASSRVQFASSGTTVLVNGAIQADVGSGVNITSGKQSFAYKVNDFAAIIQGLPTSTALTTDSTGLIPQVDYMTIGHFDFGGSDRLEGTIRKIAYYPIRVTNAQLQGLTA